MIDSMVEIQHILKRFQDGYIERDLEKLDDFMKLFADREEIELIGIGASARNGYEWFEGPARIREIIASDWQYWGDVRLEVESAKITMEGSVAWLSTVGTVLQTDHIHSDEVTDSTLAQMKDLLDDSERSPRERLVEAAHFGVRRWREREKLKGHPWPFVFTAILVKQEGQWRFHTIHWSMPVD